MDQKMSDDLTEQRSDGPKRTGLEQVRTPDILFGITPEGITVKNQRRITMNRLRRRMLALLLTAVMVVTMLPAVAWATGDSTYTRISSMEELVTGKYVMAVGTDYGPGVLDGTWVSAQAITSSSDNQVVNPAANTVWDITVGDSVVTLTDSNGVTIAPKGGNNNGIQSGAYSWGVTCSETGTFQFAGHGEDTVILASNKGSENKFRAYKSATVSGNPDGYPSDFTLYKLDEGSSEPDPTPDPDPEPEGPLTDGARVVIYNPANGKSLSTTYNGYYNMGTDVTISEGTLSGFTAADVWTVGVNADGTYTFATADGKKLSMGASYSSTPLDDVNTAWEVSDAATENCYYIKNAARGMYLEWYAEKSNWSTYGTIAADKESLFAQAFYKVSGDIPTPGGALPAAGDQVVLYNHSSQGVLAGQDDNTGSPSITSAAAELTDGKAAAANGGRVFTVEKNGDYYRFKTAHDG